jgi:4'-phosphopantetheinyl transferase
MSLEQNPLAGNSSDRSPAGELLPLASPRPDLTLHWCALDRPREQVEQLCTLLSPSERARMLRFGNDVLADRYAVGRGSLRLLLASRLGLPAAEVPIASPAGERPRLDLPAKVDFNVSHTGATAVFAIMEAARVGIDIEPEDRVVRTHDIVRKYMTASEASAIRALDSEGGRARVLRLWTCKEALSKATGDALTAPFARLEVELEPAARLVAGPPPYYPQHFALITLPGPRGFIATAAVWNARG